MGSPKALLPFGHDVDAACFVVVIANVCRAAGCYVVVSIPDGNDGDRVRAVVGDAITITNPTPSLGLSGSIIAALDHTDTVDGVGDIDALLLWPVDAPFADTALVQSLIGALDDDDIDVAVPLTTMGRGHPVLLRASTFSALRAHADDGGPRRVLDEVRVHDVIVDDVRLAMNLNTPADWQRAFSK